MSVHLGQKAELGRLALFARRSARKVTTDDGELACRCIKTRFYVASFDVKFFGVKSDDDIARFVAAIDADAGVTFFLRKMENTTHASQGVEFALNIRSLGFDLLDANTIRAGCRDPLFNTFGRGGADAVEVEAG